MKIAIHNSHISYSEQWIAYCEKHAIPYKIVNAYDSDIIHQLGDCTAFMWHHNHVDYRDRIFAKQLLYSLQEKGIKVYPDFKTTWHFDDKVGQKYLLEAINAPLVKSYVFYNKKDALAWIGTTTFPKVFKLRGGSGSSNVRLAKTRREARRLINIAFGRGFSFIPICHLFVDSLKKFIHGKGAFLDILKRAVRLIIPSKFMRMGNKEKGYAYFQDFVPGLKEDYRIQFVGKRCWAMIRNVREGDFRASGSHDMTFDHTRIPRKMLDIAYALVEKLSLQSCAFDFLIEDQKIKLVEISYCFGIDVEQRNGEFYVDEFTHGYWDENKEWHEGSFNPLGWMVEQML
ncbi:MULTISPECIES: ATP-grasp domain-containing protein [Butyricimonas]|uniref:ATP-grasp domain-containing protein n=1 Tax=Butyricimonas TaxID=574697 RepID=UPI001D08CEB5|nr:MULTISPECIES: hypothetical protein [Butyricimonas]MCB6974647.1 hypothetical protein [Butyricimonas synergistica]MCG4521389.1 hypothetical protein [Butyricimonas sp. DFI.6.44]